MENQVPQSTASRQPFRKQMAKGDLNPAIWSPTVLARHSTWRLCGWCWLAVGLREVFRDHSNFQAACSSTLLAVVCCHLPH